MASAGGDTGNPSLWPLGVLLAVLTVEEEEEEEEEDEAVHAPR